jgi:hypothetical protein
MKSKNIQSKKFTEKLGFSFEETVQFENEGFYIYKILKSNYSPKINTSCLVV